MQIIKLSVKGSIWLVVLISMHSKTVQSVSRLLIGEEGTSKAWRNDEWVTVSTASSVWHRSTIDGAFRNSTPKLHFRRSRDGAARIPAKGNYMHIFHFNR